jgi:deazaflavin-dependent oxidoreductase (nitroreductase family)
MTDREHVVAALRAGGLIDITTTGRRTGEPRRIEIVFFNFEGRLFVSGLPGRRAWVANLANDPRLTVHLKRGAQADVPATARIITDEAERRPIIERVCRAWNRTDQVETFVARAPLMEVVPDDASLLAA